MLGMLTPASAMKYLLKTVCVLTILIFTPMECYQCKTCLGECTPSSQTCEASHGCTNFKHEMKISGKLERDFTGKGCYSSNCVPLNFSISLGNDIAIAYNYQCCQSELCNQQDIKVPETSSEANGITCPVCFSQNSLQCKPVPFACTGKETKCAEVIGLTKITNQGKVEIESVFSAMGCATETACKLMNINIMGVTDLRIHCEMQSSGSLALMPITSSVLTGIFLLKVLH